VIKYLIMSFKRTVKETEVSVGDKVKIHYSFTEKDKKKSQIFEGIVLGFRGHGDNASFMVRKIPKSNIGVERIFPVKSPFIEKVEISKKGNSPKAKIYYIRDRSHKEIKDKLFV